MYFLPHTAYNWVAVRRTYVFTLQEVEKICRTLQSHVMLVWERSRTASFLEPQVAIVQLRSSHKLRANLCFHFAGSGENLPDIAKSRDASMGKKQNSFLFRTTSCHFSVEVFPQITNNLSAGDHCQRDIKEAPLYECQRISA